MDRTGPRKARKLKVLTVVSAVAGLGIFSGLAVAGTRPQSRPPSPAEQLSRLQNDLGYPFWDTSSNKAAPPQYVPTPPKASTGGS